MRSVAVHVGVRTPLWEFGAGMAAFTGWRYSSAIEWRHAALVWLNKDYVHDGAIQVGLWPNAARDRPKDQWRYLCKHRARRSHRDTPNVVGLMKQLGLMEAPEPACSPRPLHGRATPRRRAARAWPDSCRDRLSEGPNGYLLPVR